MVLRQYLRGAILMVAALVAASAIVKIAFQQAQAIVDRVVSGEIPLESAAISGLLSDSSSNSDGLVSSIAVIIFCACWLIGIIDSYRAGIALEKQ